MGFNRDKVNASASKLLSAGKYDKAIGELNRLVEHDPSDVRSLLKLGDTHVKVGKPDIAIETYQRVANVYGDQGFYLKAVAVYKQMLRVDATLASVHSQLAEMYQHLGLHSDSMQHYQKVAASYEADGKTEEALGVIKKMVDLDPDNLPSRIKLADLFAQQGKSEEALAEYQSAAKYLKDNQRVEEYIGIAERVVAIDPSNMDVTGELANTYLASGNYKKALAKLQICFQAEPRNVSILKKIGSAFEGMQQYAKAVSVYKELARIHQANQDKTAEDAAWELVRNHDPDDADLRAHDGETIGAHTTVATDVGDIAAPASAPPPPPTDVVPQSPAAAAVAPTPPPAQSTPAPSTPTPTLTPVAAPSVAAPASPANAEARKMLTETEVYLKYGLQKKAFDHLQRILEKFPGYIPAHETLAGSFRKAGNESGLADELRKLIELGGRENHPNIGEWKSELQTLGGSIAPDVPPEDDTADLILDSDDEDELDFDLLPPDSDALLIDDDILELAEATLDIEDIDLGDDDIDNEDFDILELSEDAPGVNRRKTPPAIPSNLELGELDDTLAAAADGALQELELEEPSDISLDLVDDDELLEEETEALSMLPTEAIQAVPLSDEGPEVPEELFAEPVIDAVPEAIPAPTLEPAVLVPAELEIPKVIDKVAAKEMSLEDINAALEDGAEVEVGALYSDEDLDVAAADDLVDDGLVAGDISVLDGDPFADMSQDDFTDILASEEPILPPDQHATAATPPSPTIAESAAPAAIDLSDASGHTEGDDDWTEGTMAEKLGVVEAQHGFENDIAAAFFPDELEEAEFLLQQDVLDEAKEVLEEIVDSLPEESPRVAHMLARLAAKERGEPEPPAPWEQNLLNSVAEELVDMSDERDAEPRQVSIDEVLSQFQAGVKEQVDDSDADTHYNLGIAYREMGLLNEAVSEFEIAARAESKAADAYHLIGLTHVGLVAYADAVQSFERALSVTGLPQKTQAANHYHRGRSLVELGRQTEAVSAFETAKKLGTDLRDIDKRLSDARAHEAETPQVSGKNIDYV